MNSVLSWKRTSKSVFMARNTRQVFVASTIGHEMCWHEMCFELCFFANFRIDRGIDRIFF